MYYTCTNKIVIHLGLKYLEYATHILDISNLARITIWLPSCCWIVHYNTLLRVQTLLSISYAYAVCRKQLCSDTWSSLNRLSIILCISSCKAPGATLQAQSMITRRRLQHLFSYLRHTRDL